MSNGAAPIRDALDDKVNRLFAGKVVRKDLVRKVKVGANVPVFVLEFLLGKYCASSDEVSIQMGMQVVLDTLANALFAKGIESGYASLAATGTGMYPIVPALLGMIALGERLAPNQIIGIVVLVIGLAMLGAVS